VKKFSSLLNKKYLKTHEILIYVEDMKTGELVKVYHDQLPMRLEKDGRLTYLGLLTMMEVRRYKKIFDTYKDYEILDIDVDDDHLQVFIELREGWNNEKI